MKINSRLGIFQRLWGESKRVIHSILRKLEETGLCEAKKPPGRPRKTTAREDRWIGNESKKDWFATATTISKRDNANLGIKISGHTISWRLNYINLNSQVASTKPYISKKNKMSWLKFTTEHIILTEEQWDFVLFSDESKFNLFGWDERRFVQHNPKECYLPWCTKSCIKFGGGSVMVFGMISVLVQELLSAYTVKLMQLYTKRYWRNMLYLIWELQLINQLYLCKITLCDTQRSLLRHFFLRRMLLLWISGLLKA